MRIQLHLSGNQRYLFGEFVTGGFVLSIFGDNINRLVTRPPSTETNSENEVSQVEYEYGRPDKSWNFLQLNLTSETNYNSLFKASEERTSTV